MMYLANSFWAPLAKQMRAADGFGRLIGWGFMDQRECLDALLVAASDAMPNADPSGRRMVMAHALRDAVQDWNVARDRALAQIRRELRPLLDARRPAAELVNAAQEINRGHRRALLRVEVEDAVRDVIASRLRAMQWEERQAR